MSGFLSIIDSSHIVLHSTALDNIAFHIALLCIALHCISVCVCCPQLILPAVHSGLSCRFIDRCTFVSAAVHLGRRIWAGSWTLWTFWLVASSHLGWLVSIVNILVACLRVHIWVGWSLSTWTQAATSEWFAHLINRGGFTLVYTFTMGCKVRIWRTTNWSWSTSYMLSKCIPSFAWYSIIIKLKVHICAIWCTFLQNWRDIWVMG